MQLSSTMTFAKYTLILLYTLFISPALLAGELEMKQTLAATIGLSRLTIECLERSKISTLGELANLTIEQLGKMSKNRVTVQRELRMALHDRNLRLIDEPNDDLATLHLRAVSESVLRSAGKTTMVSLLALSKDDIQSLPNSTRHLHAELQNALAEKRFETIPRDSDIQIWLKATMSQTPNEEVRRACQILLREF